MSGDFTMAGSGPFSLGTLIWLPVMVLLVVGLFVLSRVLYRYAASEKAQRVSDDGIARWAARACIAVVVLLVGFTLLGMYPYKGEYHQWRDVSGTVDKIDHRLIGTGSSMEDKFVVRFANSGGKQFGCDDTRCASVEAGDHLTLSCKRVWQYTGTDGYDCRFTATVAARE